MFSYPFLAHQLPQICWWPSDLCKCKTPLDTLQDFARNFITHDVTFFSIMKLLACTSLVDTNHGDTNGPGSFADAQAEIIVVGVDIASFLEGFDNLHYRSYERVVEVASFKLSKQLFM